MTKKTKNAVVHPRRSKGGPKGDAVSSLPPADQYAGWARNVFAPARFEAERNLQARLAQQGILSTTGGQGAIARALAGVASQEAQAAEEMRRWDINRQDTLSQQAWERAARAYELQQAGAIGMAPYVTKVKWPGQPKMFQGAYNQMWATPRPSFGGPAGDPQEYWPTSPMDVTGRMREQQAYESAEAAKARAAAQSQWSEEAALREREMQMQAATAGLKWVPGQGWVKTEAESQAKREDMMRTVGAWIEGNLRSTPEEGQQYPSVMAKLIETTYNVDLKAMVRSGDTWAIKVIKTLWPNTGEAIIQRILRDPYWDFGQPIGEVPEGAILKPELEGRTGFLSGPALTRERFQQISTGNQPFSEIRGADIIPWLYGKFRSKPISDMSPGESAIQSMGAAPSVERPWYLQSPAGYFTNKLFKR